MNSEASIHSTSDRKLFITYTLGYFGVVKIGNYGKCKVVDFRDVSVLNDMG